MSSVSGDIKKMMEKEYTLFEILEFLKRNKQYLVAELKRGVRSVKVKDRRLVGALVEAASTMVAFVNALEHDFGNPVVGFFEVLLRDVSDINYTIAEIVRQLCSGGEGK